MLAIMCDGPHDQQQQQNNKVYGLKIKDIQIKKRSLKIRKPTAFPHNKNQQILILT